MVKIVTIKLDEDILAKVDSFAEANNVSRSDVIREALRKFFEVV